MSTRAHIIVQLSGRARGKKYEFNPENLPSPYNETFFERNNKKVMEKLCIPLTLDKEYLIGYNHYNSMPDYLGRHLLNFTTEDEVINLLMGGDISNISTRAVEYIGLQPFKDIAHEPGAFMPKLSDKYPRPLDRDYTYLFDGERNEWIYRHNTNFVYEEASFTEESEWVRLSVWTKKGK